MADDYEVTAVREITDVDPSTDELLDYVEVHAKTKPHGIAFSIRVPAKDASAGDINGQVAAKAQSLEAIASA